MPDGTAEARLGKHGGCGTRPDATMLCMGPPSGVSFGLCPLMIAKLFALDLIFGVLLDRQALRESRGRVS